MSPPATALRLVGEEGGGPSPGDVASLRRWLRALDLRAARVETGGMTFLVVTPLGVRERATMAGMLADLRIAPAFVSAVSPWPAAATALYVKRLDDASLRRALLFERAWSRLFPRAAAEAWALPPGAHAAVDAVKRAVRAELPHLHVGLGAADGGAVLHPFHLADPRDATLEARRLVAASFSGPAAGAVPGRFTGAAEPDRI